MVKKRIITVLKIGTIMVISFILTALINQEFFIADSPQIRPNLPQHVALRFNQLGGGDFSAIATMFLPGRSSESDIAVEDTNPNVPPVPDSDGSTEEGNDEPFVLESVSQGVYAGEQADTTVIEVYQDDITWAEDSITIDGTTYEFSYPEDQPEPSNEELEAIFGTE